MKASKHIGLNAFMLRRMPASAAPDLPDFDESVRENIARTMGGRVERQFGKAVLASLQSSTVASSQPTLVDIARMLDAAKAVPPDPFNGARRIYAATDVHDKLAPEAKTMLFGVEFVCSPYMPPGTAWGVRPRQPSDPADALDVPGLGVIVFVIRDEGGLRG